MISVEKADSMIKEAMALQRQLAEDTTQFEILRFKMAGLTPSVDYTETTERIFSSSIETINTVGNVLFTENVAAFYQKRSSYKTSVCDSIANSLLRDSPLTTVKGTLGVYYGFYAISSRDIVNDMRHLYAQCKQMMAVTDEEIDAYRKQREQIDESSTEDGEGADSIINKIIEHLKFIEAQKKLLKLE